MIKALLLIFEPIATWEGISRAKRGLLFVLGTYLLPMLLLTSAAEGYGLMHWGKPQGQVPRLRHFILGEALFFEIAQIILFLIVVFVCTRLVQSIGTTFHSRHSFSQAFATVAYGLGPLLWLRFLDAFPGFSPWAPWVSWGIGIVLSLAVLYHGVPRMMDPDPSHAFGLYVMSALLLFLVTGVVRFLTAFYLQGKFGDMISILPP
jgi:hypothetical protein